MTAASLIAIFLIPVTFAVVESLSYRLSRHPQQQPEAGDPKGGQPA
jgi:hypothetical protein